MRVAQIDHHIAILVHLPIHRQPDLKNEKVDDTATMSSHLRIVHDVSALTLLIIFKTPRLSSGLRTRTLIQGQGGGRSQSRQMK
jgi:hypothetical protein